MAQVIENEGQSKRRAVVPSDCTTLRPDVVLWSGEAKKIILTGVMVPWEEESEHAFERKSAEYQNLLQGKEGKEWQMWLKTL